MSSRLTPQEATHLANAANDNANYWAVQVDLFKRHGHRRAARVYACLCRDARRRARYFTQRAKLLRAAQQSVQTAI